MRPKNSLNHPRLERERKTIQIMIRMYCRARHQSTGSLCEACRQLQVYAERRLKRCPYGAGKPTCANCPTHCYKPAMRDEIRRVMRFAGPRMLFRHPWLAVMHLVDSRRTLTTEPNDHAS